MRGLSKIIAMAVLAGGFSVVPAIGSRGAGALGERQVHADAQLVHSAALDALQAADNLAAQRAVALVR